jgi:hypothetical protein
MLQNGATDRAVGGCQNQILNHRGRTEDAAEIEARLTLVFFGTYAGLLSAEEI